MASAQLPQRIPSAINESAGEWTSHSNSFRGGESWARSLAVCSLIAGTILLVRGRRRAGLAAAATGAAIALLDDPGYASDLWKSIPSHIETGKRLLAQAEGFVEELETQREKLRGLLEKAWLR